MNDAKSFIGQRLPALNRDPRDPREAFDCPKCGEVTYVPALEYIRRADNNPNEYIRVSCGRCGFAARRPVLSSMAVGDVA